MTPEERQLLAGLFDRVRAAETMPRDREAEAFIADAVRAQPHAPYLLAQTVLVQEHALRAADEKLQQLEAQVQDLQRAAAPSEGGGSFLGGLGRSLFGGEPPHAAAPSHTSVPPSGPWAAQPAYPPQQQPGYPPQHPGYPPPPPPPQWSGAPQAPMGGGGSFLHGALGAAAGVAGGVLLADSIRGLFSGRANPFGMGSGFGGLGGLGGLGGMPGGFGAANTGGETVINNYYENANNDPGQSTDTGYDDGGAGNDAGFQDTSDDWSGGDDGGGMTDT